MAQLRTKETHDKYMKFIESGFLAEKCGLCADNSIKEFNYWKIIDNLFPYDSVAKVHHMIIPKRHVVEDELNEEEKNELKEIKMGYINQEYDYMLEPTHQKKSIPEHFHIHLIVAKDLN